MKSFVYVILASVLVGTIGIFVNLIGDSVHFATMNFYRVFFGFLFLLAVVPFLDRETFKVKITHASEFLIVAVVMVFTFFLYNVAYLLAPVQNVILITAMYPFFVLFIAYFMIHERITKTKVITLAIAVVGLAVINPLNAEGFFLGNTIALVDAVLYAFLIVLMRREDKRFGIRDVLWFFFFATLIMLPAPFVFGFGNIVPVLPYLVGLGVLSTGLVHLLFNLALENMEAEIVSITETIAAPIVAILLAFFILAEEINARIIIGGGILIFAGIYLETHRKRLKEKGKGKKGEGKKGNARGSRGRRKKRG